WTKSLILSTPRSTGSLIRKSKRVLRRHFGSRTSTHLSCATSNQETEPRESSQSERAGPRAERQSRRAGFPGFGEGRSGAPKTCIHHRELSGRSCYRIGGNRHRHCRREALTSSVSVSRVRPML